jgi:serine/threonine protein phosphatase 1
LLKPTIHKRNLCISDIHGCFDLLRELVEKVIRFDPTKDKLIFLGDYIDLSANSMKVVLYLQELKERFPDNIILLIGNHEEMAYRALIQPKKHSSTKKKYEERWFKYGGRATLSSFGGERLARNILVPFIESLLPYYETDTHIFVHGGIPVGAKNIRNVSVHDLIWNRSRDYDGRGTLVVGHCPHPQVKQTGAVICVDTGAYWYGKLSAYDSTNNVIYEVSKGSSDRDSEKKMTYSRKILSHSNIT